MWAIRTKIKRRMAFNHAAFELVEPRGIEINSMPLPIFRIIDISFKNALLQSVFFGGIQKIKSDFVLIKDK